MLGFQIVFENNGNHTWYEDHGSNPIPIPLRLHVSIRSNNTYDDDEDIYENDLNFNHFKLLANPLVSCGKKLKGLEDYYYLDSYHLEDKLKSEHYFVNIDVLNSADTTIYQTSFPIIVIQDDLIAEKVQLNVLSLLPIRINQKIIDPITFIITNNSNRQLSDRKMTISLSISNENFQLLNNDLVKFPCIVDENVTDKVQYITVNSVSIISGPNMGLSVLWKVEENFSSNIESFKEEVFQLKFDGLKNENSFSIEGEITFKLYSDLPFKFDFFNNELSIEDSENEIIVEMLFNEKLPDFYIQCYDQFNNFAFPVSKTEKWKVQIELQSDYTPSVPQFLSSDFAKALYKKVSDKLLSYLKKIALKLTEENHGQLHFTNIASFDFDTKCRLGTDGIVIAFNLLVIGIVGFLPFPLKLKIVNEPKVEQIHRIEISDGTGLTWCATMNKIPRTNILKNIKIKTYNSSNKEIVRFSNDQSLDISCNWGDYNTITMELPELNLEEDNNVMLEQFNLFGDDRKESLKLKVTVKCNIWETNIEFDYVMYFKISIPFMFDIFKADSYPLVIKSLQSWKSVFCQGFRLFDDSRKEYNLSSLTNDQKSTLSVRKPGAKSTAICQIPLTIKDNRFHIDFQEENNQNITNFEDIISTLVQWKVKAKFIEFNLSLQYNSVAPLLYDFQIEITTGIPKTMKLFHKYDPEQEVGIFQLDLYLLLNGFKIKFFDEYGDLISTHLLKDLIDHKKLKLQIFKDETLLCDFSLTNANGDLNNCLHFRDFEKLVFDSNTAQVNLNIEGQLINPYSCEIHRELDDIIIFKCPLIVEVTRHETISNLSLSSSNNNDTNIFIIHEILNPDDEIKRIFYKPVTVSSDTNKLINTYLNLKTDNSEIITDEVFESHILRYLTIKIYYSSMKIDQIESSSDKIKPLTNNQLKVEDFFDINHISDTNTILLNPKIITKKLKEGVYQIQGSYKEKRTKFNSLPIHHKNFEVIFSYEVTPGSLSDIFWKNHLNETIEGLFEETKKVSNLNLNILSMLLILRDKNSNVIKDTNNTIECILFNVTTQNYNNKLCLKTNSFDGIVKLEIDEDFSFVLEKHSLEIVESHGNSENFSNDEFHIIFQVRSNNSIVFSKTTQNFNYVESISLENEKDLKESELVKNNQYLNKYKELKNKVNSLKNLIEQKKLHLEKTLAKMPAISYFCGSKDPVNICEKFIETANSIPTDLVKVPDKLTSSFNEIKDVIKEFNLLDSNYKFDGKFLYELISVRQEFFHSKKVS